MAAGEWDEKLDHLRHRCIHHIDEEEQEYFPDFGQYLTDEDVWFMRGVFDRRKGGRSHARIARGRQGLAFSVQAAYGRGRWPG